MQWPTGGKSDGGQLPLVPVEAIQDVFSFWACSGFGQVNGFVVLPKPFLAQEGVRSHFGSSASAGLRRPQEAHRSLLECGRRRFHWRPQTKAHCGGPLYVDYDEFPNCGGISFEGPVSDSTKAPVSGPLVGWVGVREGAKERRGEEAQKRRSEEDNKRRCEEERWRRVTFALDRTRLCTVGVAKLSAS